MILRDVTPDDVETYVRMRCDPVMMAELGGPLPRAGMERVVARQAAATAEDRSWIQMIVPEPADPDAVAGQVTLFRHQLEAGPISEIGWMVLPEYQGHGLATAATRLLLERAGRDGRWGTVHAFPTVNNGPSNGICRALGFTLAGRRDIDFNDQIFRVNDWRIDPVTEFLTPNAGSSAR
jgi:RimJ/RimL family protein N-acetyltransferase